MFLNMQETSSSVRKKMPSSGTAEHRNDPTSGQLWSVMEFSRQYPELTMYLVADLQAAERADATRIQADEPLEFPPLVAPDPRELWAHAHKKQHEEEDIEEELALFAAGKLPPEPLPPPATPPKETKHIWQYLLTFFTLVLMLLWLSNRTSDLASSEGGTVHLSAAPSSTQQRSILVAEQSVRSVPSTTCTPNFFSRLIFRSS
jgi:hypothetical protein